MEDLSRRQCLGVNVEYDKNLIMRLHKLLCDGGIKQSEDKRRNDLCHVPLTNMMSVKSDADNNHCHETSVLVLDETDHFANIDIHNLAAEYAEERNALKKTPLHLSAESGDTELVNVFLKAGAAVNAEDEDKQTPLHLSARNGHTEIVTVLLECGAKVDAEDCWKQTPLHLSIQYDKKDIVEILSKKAANVNNSQRVRSYSSSAGMLVWMLKVIYSLIARVITTWDYGAITTASLDTVTIDSTFTTSESFITQSDNSASNNGHGHESAHSPAPEMSGPQTEYPEMCNADLEETQRVVQQVEEYWANFPLHNKIDSPVSKTTAKGVKITLAITIKVVHVINISHADMVSIDSQNGVRDTSSSQDSE